MTPFLSDSEAKFGKAQHTPAESLTLIHRTPSLMIIFISNVFNIFLPDTYFYKQRRPQPLTDSTVHSTVPQRNSIPHSSGPGITDSAK
jgi:hypothetical protein